MKSKSFIKIRFLCKFMNVLFRKIQAFDCMSKVKIITNEKFIQLKVQILFSCLLDMSQNFLQSIIFFTSS